MAKLSEEQKKQRAKTRQENKKKQEQKELESRIQTSQEKDLAKARKYRNSPAKRTFEVGQEVHVINAQLKNMKVVEVLDEGKTYKIAKANSTDFFYFNWAQIVDTATPSNPVSFIKKSSLYHNLSFSNREVSDLLSKAYYFGIDMEPDYQRGLVWEEKNKIALLDSMFKGIDIGKFVFITKASENTNEPFYEILDGKQRLNALLDFFNDEFKYQGYYFSQLCPPDQRYLNRYIISVAQTEEPLSDKEKYEYFLSLNIGGIPQSEEQIKKVKKLLTALT